MRTEIYIELLIVIVIARLQNLLDYLGHLGNVHKMLVFRVSKESTTDVSLYQPFYDKFPLTVYSKFRLSNFFAKLSN